MMLSTSLKVSQYLTRSLYRTKQAWQNRVKQSITLRSTQPLYLVARAQRHLVVAQCDQRFDVQAAHFGEEVLIELQARLVGRGLLPGWGRCGSRRWETRSMVKPISGKEGQVLFIVVVEIDAPRLG